jgi:hypothetical protein
MNDEEKAQSRVTAGAKDRTSRRHPVHDDASLCVIGQDLIVPCSVQFRAEAQLHVEVTFRIRGIPMLLPGVIQWTDCAENFGIRFSDMRARRKEGLVEVLTEIATLQEERLAREAPAAQRQAEIEAQTGVHDHERRAYPRHAIHTTAVITRSNTGTQLRGWLVDLSLGGCRVRTDEPSQLNPETRVSAELLLGGVLLYASGVVEANEDRHILRIRFVDMSDAQREKAGRLIEQLQKQHPEGPGNQGQSGGR